MQIIIQSQTDQCPKTHQVDIGKNSPLACRFYGNKYGNSTEIKEAYFIDIVTKLLAMNPDVTNYFYNITTEAILVCDNPSETLHASVVAHIWKKLFFFGNFCENLTAFVQNNTRLFPSFHRDLDGKNHINIWTKGKTLLGQMLSNLAFTPFTHPQYGEFASIEGLWYWLITGKKHEELRKLHGFQAKSDGSLLMKHYGDSIIIPQTFMQDIKSGILAKIEQTPKLKQLLKESTVPLTHYFVYGDKVVDQVGYRWITNYISLVRDWLNGKAYKLLIAGSRYTAVIEDEFDDFQLVMNTYKKFDLKAIQIISGCAKGADTLGIALANHLALPVVKMPADWNTHGKRAGIIRNAEMEKVCDAALIFWNGISSGTKDMIDRIKESGKPIQVASTEIPFRQSSE